EGNGNIEIDGVGEEGTHTIPINMKDREKDIQKQGTPSSRYEAEYIDWEITVNAGRALLENAQITDELPDGLEFVEDSLEIYEQVTSVNGTVLREEPVDKKNS